jgi:26S proteasome regulatory subunit N2
MLCCGYVEIGALIALAMVLIQCSEAFQPKVTEVRQLIRERYSNKHEPVMARFGAILAQVFFFFFFFLYS